jgi:hypothetical protein
MSEPRITPRIAWIEKAVFRNAGSSPRAATIRHALDPAARAPE